MKYQIEERQELLNIFAPSSLSFEEANILTDKIIETGYRQQSEGEWKQFAYGELKCSVCGMVQEDNPYRYNFCPNCGAKMKGGAE